ncbi:MAG: prepilin-type N-terminal cleavage/methylation domain-containing protein [FCB group bacterium]|nr:prepilin-type N-terminal cleavage/methylation domain-containing protein [FCB group bacterium]
MEFKGNKGFTLIELVVVIVIVAILAAIAVDKLAPVGNSIRTDDSMHEMDALAFAIVGNPELQSGGIRTDFGYVGDVGALPPNLDALIANPGSYSTWNGPYIQNSFVQAVDDFKKDAWQTDYAYGGGVIITSTGSGENVIRRLAGSNDDLLRNPMSGNVFDYEGKPPGSDYKDSIQVLLTVPNGLGGMSIKSSSVDIGGYYSFDSIPIGNHDFEIIYEPNDDTVKYFVSIIPNSSFYQDYYLPSVFPLTSPSSVVAGLVGHWRLDETSGTTASDVSGNGNDGTLINMNPSNDWVTGKINGALDFDGNNDYVNIPHAAVLNGTAQLTYSAWIQPDTWSGSIRQIMAKSVHGGGSGRAQMGIFSEGGSLTGRAETTAGRFNVLVTLPPIDVWSMVALVFDGASLSLYVNGVVAGVAILPNTTLRQTTDDLCISKRVGTSQYYFDGSIDDVRIYDRALNATEIQTLYNMGS